MAATSIGTHTFITRSLSRRANARMLAWLIGTALMLCVAIALAPSKLRELLAWLLAFVPAGGYVLLSWLYEREMTYNVSEAGLEVRSEPAHRDFTLIDPQRWHYDWGQISDFAEGDTFLLGRYGYLEIWVQAEGHDDPRCLRLTPGRRRELPAFDEFAEAFRREVELLNADQTARAVAVATIRRRPTLFEHPMARVAAVVLAVLVTGLYLVDLFSQWDEATEWRLAYLYLLLFPLAFYALRRSFFMPKTA